MYTNSCRNRDTNIYAALVKRLRRSPLTAESRVRFPDAVPIVKNLELELKVFLYPYTFTPHVVSLSYSIRVT